MTSRAMANDHTYDCLKYFFGQRVSVKIDGHVLEGIFDGFTPEMRAMVKIKGDNPFKPQPGYVNAFLLSCVSPLEPKRTTTDVISDPLQFFFGQRVSVKAEGHNLTGIFEGYTPKMRAKVKIEGENPFETQPGNVNTFCLSCVSPLEPNLARKNYQNL